MDSLLHRLIVGVLGSGLEMIELLIPEALVINHEEALHNGVRVLLVQHHG